MDRSIRMAKSEAARKKRKSVKEIKETLQKRMFSRLKNKRKKLQKIKNRQHDK